MRLIEFLFEDKIPICVVYHHGRINGSAVPIDQDALGVGLLNATQNMVGIVLRLRIDRTIAVHRLEDELPILRLGGEPEEVLPGNLVERVVAGRLEGRGIRFGERL